MSNEGARPQPAVDSSAAANATTRVSASSAHSRLGPGIRADGVAGSEGKICQRGKYLRPRRHIR